MRKIIKFYDKNKTFIIIALISLVIISLSVQLYLFHREKLSEQDMFFADLSWSEFCDGRIYTDEEKKEFCDTCFEFGDDKCRWPLDITVKIAGIDKIIKKGGEIHCYLVINDVNYYHEKGKYYGVINETFFTWDLLYATQNHHVQVCCGIEKQNPVATIVGLEKKWPQACVEKEVDARCVQN